MAQAPTQDFIVNSGLTVLGTATVTSSTGNTSTLQVDGGAAIAKNLIVGDDAVIYGDLTVYGNLPFLSITTGTFTNLTVTGLSTLNATTLGVSTASQLDVAARLLVGGLSELNNATLSNQTNSTSSTTGALQVSGGVGIQKDLWVGGKAYVDGYEVLTTATVIASTLQAVTEQGSSTTVAISVLNTTSSTSTDTGALTVVGGVGIGGDLYANALYINTASYINNSLIITTATVDLYATKTSILAGTDTAVNTSTGVVTIWNTSTLQSVTDRGSTTTNAIVITNTQSSTTTVAGNALQVSGGAGINGNLYIGGIVAVTNTTSAISTTTGALVVGGGVGIGGALFVETSATISTNSGGLGTGLRINKVDLFAFSASGSNAGAPTFRTSISSATTVFRVMPNNTATNGIGAQFEFFANDYFTTPSGWHNFRIVASTSSFIIDTAKDLAGDQPRPIIFNLGGQGVATNTATYANVLTLTTSGVGINTLTPGAQFGVEGTVRIAGTATITSTTNSISTTTGALVVSGGVGIGRDLYVGGIIYGTLIGSGSISTASNLASGTAGQVPYQTAPGVTSFYGPGTAGDVLVSNGTSAPTYNNTLTLTSTLSNTTTVAGNALQVLGGVGIAGGLHVDGPAYFLNNVVFAGTSTSIFSTTTVYTDNYLELHFPSGPSGPSGVWTVDDGKDIGHIYHHYKDATGDEHGALIWHNASDELRWYMGGVDLNTATQVWEVSTATFGVFRTGSIQLQNNISATSTTTGTLVVVGGVGVGGGLYVGGISTFTSLLVASAGVQTTNIVASGTLGVTGTSTLGVLNATSATFSGTLGVTGTSTLRVLNATSATFSGTLGVTGTSVLAGVTSITNATSATSTATGALVVSGGAGIGGDLYIGGTIYGTIVGSISTATNLAGGTAGQVPYQTAPGVTSFYGPGTAGNVLVSNGAGAPTYNNTLTLTGTTAATSTSTGALRVLGGVGVGGSLFVGNTINAGVSGASVFSPISALNIHRTLVLAGLYETSTATWTTDNGSNAWAVGQIGGYVAAGFGNAVGNFPGGLMFKTKAADGLSTSLPTTKMVLDAAGNLLLGTTNNLTTTGTSNLVVAGTASATSTASGALQVIGGAGIGGALYAGSIYDAGNRVVTNVAPSGSTYIGISNLISTGTATSFTINNLGVTSLTGTTYLAVSTSTGNVTLTNLGVQTLTAGTDTAVSSNTGTVIVWNTSTLQTVTGRGASTNNAISITNTTSATSTATGALVVSGGVGIGRDLYVGGTIYGTIVGSISTATNLTGGTAGQVPYQTAPGATSFYGPGTAGNVLVSNGTSAPTYNNTLTLVGTTTSISTTTGALQVLGGVGVGGSVYVGNRVGFVGTNSASVVYQYYNAATGSLDTVFG